MVTTTMAAKRTRMSNSKEKGFYRLLNGESDLIEDSLSSCSDRVYEVERLVEKKRVKVSHGGILSGPQLAASFYFRV